MEPTYIPHLANRQDRTLEIIVDCTFPDLETLTPVRGKIRVEHKGNYLDVSAKAETIVTISCYRCLQQYNHRINLTTQESIWLDPDAGLPYDGPLEREMDEDMMESLPPDGHFKADEWLYEQICLSIPQRQLCDRDCQGIAHQANPEPIAPQVASDLRWGALGNLKQQLEQ
jgi:uncharacterized protein